MRGNALGHRSNRRRPVKGKKDVQEQVETSPHATQPTHSEDGVDLTLVRWMLSLSPARRLQVLHENVRAMLRLRRESTQLPFDTSDAAKRGG